MVFTLGWVHGEVCGRASRCWEMLRMLVQVSVVAEMHGSKLGNGGCCFNYQLQLGFPSSRTGDPKDDNFVSLTSPHTLAASKVASRLLRQPLII